MKTRRRVVLGTAAFVLFLSRVCSGAPVQVNDPAGLQVASAQEAITPDVAAVSEVVVAEPEVAAESEVVVVAPEAVAVSEVAAAAPEAVAMSDVTAASEDVAVSEAAAVPEIASALTADSVPNAAVTLQAQLVFEPYSILDVCDGADKEQAAATSTDREAEIRKEAGKDGLQDGKKGGDVVEKGSDKDVNNNNNDVAAFHEDAMTRDRFSICNTWAEPAYKITNVTSTKYLCRGCQACIDIQGRLERPIEKGSQVRVKLSLFIFEAFDETYDLCELLERNEAASTEAKATRCTVEPNSDGFRACLSLPDDIVPDVEADLKVLATNADGSLLFCLQGAAKVESQCPEGYASATAAKLIEDATIAKKRVASDESSPQQLETIVVKAKQTFKRGTVSTLLNDGDDTTVKKKARGSKKTFTSTTTKTTTVVVKESVTVQGDGRPRCSWASNPANIPMQVYHDTEWAVKGGFNRTNRYLFEMLILEGAQAGLSWSTIVAKRDAYREAYANFDYIKISDTFKSPAANEKLMQANIVKNRLKVEASLLNARLFRELLEELYPDQAKLDDQEGFWLYLQQFKIGGARVAQEKLKKKKERQNGECLIDEEEAKQELTCYSTRSLESDRLSAALKKRGFKFVGTTICYTYLIAVGMVEDHALAHLPGCHRHPSAE
ncbi:hypothetical protein BGW41_001602 [Actinomortierella wolfii]|nr:hypothetical protein BGW41_001602 [Actinomortierella wolfii]